MRVTQRAEFLFFQEKDPSESSKRDYHLGINIAQITGTVEEKLSNIFPHTMCRNAKKLKP
ncbi:MAG: hypothetical protein HNEKOMLI_00093 [Sodalis sp. Psp]|nr:hypothetical protein [Sodalis sp. Psp]MCR3756598.1 hypothetical protein [Sodalis sp. Ppy]